MSFELQCVISWHARQKKKKTTEHLTQTDKGNSDYCDSQIPRKKSNTAKHKYNMYNSVAPWSCTNMLARDKSIFYLLLIPCNMRKKEGAI